MATGLRYTRFPMIQSQRSNYCEQGWTDGLPVVPPTPVLVDAMLAFEDALQMVLAAHATAWS